MKIHIVIDMPEISKEQAYDSVVEKIIEQVEKIQEIQNHDWWTEIES